MDRGRQRPGVRPVTGRGPGTGGPGRGGNPGNPSGQGGAGRPGRPWPGNRRPGQGPGQAQGPRRPGDPRASGPNPGLPPDRTTGPSARLPPDRTPGQVPRVAPDRSAGSRAPQDRITGPGKRLPPNAGMPRGDRAARPDPVPRPPRGSRRPPLRGGAGGGARRPPRPPRWLTVRRGEPGRRVGITLLTVAIVLTLFAGRLVQLQGMESGYYKAQAAVEQVRVRPAARAARHDLRLERAAPGDDPGDLYGHRGPAADPGRG